jgi:hypothetical protein
MDTKPITPQRSAAGDICPNCRYGHAHLSRDDYVPFPQDGPRPRLAPALVCRVCGYVEEIRVLEAAAILGRRGGLAGKRAGRDYAAMGAKGGAAGKGKLKPRR